VVLFLFNVIETNVLRESSTSEFSRSLGQQRTFCNALHYVPRKGSELGADVSEAAYVGLSLLREFERRRDMADEYAGCH
jgi:hypothetical protein